VGLLNERGFACSGVLIHPKAVLTARHCRGMKQVVFGADATKPVARRKIVREAVAPNPAIDMAVLVLADNAPVAPYGLTLSAHPPRQLHVVGYGCTSQDCSNGAGRRSHFSFDYRDLNWGCDRIAAAQTGCIQGFELVLSGSRQADTCVGDSGGPVLERWGDQWRVVAITSRAVADSVLPCGDGGIYVRVEPQQGWLRKVIGKL
jgi:V8-like Glu-specific endopeptidase